MIDRENKNALFIKAVIIHLRRSIRGNILIFATHIHTKFCINHCGKK